MNSIIFTCMCFALLLMASNCMEDRYRGYQVGGDKFLCVSTCPCGVNLQFMCSKEQLYTDLESSPHSTVCRCTAFAASNEMHQNEYNRTQMIISFNCSGSVKKCKDNASREDKLCKTCAAQLNTECACMNSSQTLLSTASSNLPSTMLALNKTLTLSTTGFRFLQTNTPAALSSNTPYSPKNTSTLNISSISPMPVLRVAKEDENSESTTNSTTASDTLLIYSASGAAALVVVMGCVLVGLLVCVCHLRRKRAGRNRTSETNSSPQAESTPHESHIREPEEAQNESSALQIEPGMSPTVATTTLVLPTLTPQGLDPSANAPVHTYDALLPATVPPRQSSTHVLHTNSHASINPIVTIDEAKKPPHRFLSTQSQSALPKYKHKSDHYGLRWKSTTEIANPASMQDEEHQYDHIPEPLQYRLRSLSVSSRENQLAHLYETPDDAMRVRACTSPQAQLACQKPAPRAAKRESTHNHPTLHTPDSPHLYHVLTGPTQTESERGDVERGVKGGHSSTRVKPALRLPLPALPNIAPKPARNKTQSVRLRLVDINLPVEEPEYDVAGPTMTEAPKYQSKCGTSSSFEVLTEHRYDVIGPAVPKRRASEPKSGAFSNHLTHLRFVPGDPPSTERAAFKSGYTEPHEASSQSVFDDPVYDIVGQTSANAKMSSMVHRLLSPGNSQHPPALRDESTSDNSPESRVGGDSTTGMRDIYEYDFDDPDSNV